ncbi:MAG: flagellar protein FlaG [Candidatus Eremiobacteraeota bacterium]|nr:flagellar protein FlaG [Candidatus Eremiobacteraeota bacterium]
MDVQSVAGAGAPPVLAAQDAAVSQPANAPLDVVPTTKDTTPGESSHHGAATSTRDSLHQLYAPQAQQFEVSFRVEHDPNEIVTVFRDAATGQEIAQFPPEVMVQLAQFFQKIAGDVVDRSA